MSSENTRKRRREDSRSYSSKPTDSEMFVGFYRRTVDCVYSYLLRRTAGDRHLAEDLTQETYMTAMKTFRSGIKNEEAWATSIARRRLVDHVRRGRRIALPIEANTLEVLSSTEPAKEADLMEAIRILEPDQQLAVLLHYMDGLRVGEVASVLDRSPAAVYSLLARARQKLKDLLARPVE